MNTESHGETYSHKYTTSTGDIFNKKNKPNTQGNTYVITHFENHAFDKKKPSKVCTCKVYLYGIYIKS